MLSWSPTARTPWAHPPSSSSGPGRRPFKAVARVRIPLGARRDAVRGRVATRKVLWSSLECTPPCQGGGRGFKSRQDRSGVTPAAAREAKPTGGGGAVSARHGRIAQLAEHAPEKRGVTGSTPVPATHHRTRV